jgi:hypothetical protein
MFVVTWLDFQNIILIFIVCNQESLCVACVRTFMSLLLRIPLFCCITYDAVRTCYVCACQCIACYMLAQSTKFVLCVNFWTTERYRSAKNTVGNSLYSILEYFYWFLQCHNTPVQPCFSALHVELK